MNEVSTFVTLSLFNTNVFECAICGAKGPREMFDVHHISYDPEIRVLLCASCHAIITRNRLSPEAQFQIRWANETLKLTLKAYMKRLIHLQSEISRLERLKKLLEDGIFDVKIASSPEEAIRLLSKGYEPVAYDRNSVHVFKRSPKTIEAFLKR